MWRWEGWGSVGKAHANSRPNARYRVDDHSTVLGADHDAAGDAAVAERIAEECVGPLLRQESTRWLSD
jgi:hypothetical protein